MKIICKAHYILSQLGEGTEANLSALMDTSVCGPAPEKGWQKLGGFKNMCLKAAKGCINAIDTKNDFDIKSKRVGIVIATTKGAVALLAQGKTKLPSEVAQEIACELGNPNEPLVVCNACISGVHAQIIALRKILSGEFDHVLVIGADEVSPFISLGFNSLKATSPIPCRPFDIERTGLNLGEAAAAIIMSKHDNQCGLSTSTWQLIGEGVANDASHISNPSKTAEGAWRALSGCMRESFQNAGIRPEDLACISAHGTATMYNDEMESVAIHRAHLQDIPVSGLKGFYGHTMGAAGLLETIITMAAIEKGIILPTKGFKEQGTSRKLIIYDTCQSTSKHSFIKMISGFGGCNAAVCWSLQDECHRSPVKNIKLEEIAYYKKCGMCSTLVDEYHELIGDYPKFHKMDILSKVGILGAEYIIREINSSSLGDLLAENTGIIICGKSGTIITDRKFQETIQDQENCYPSPSLFVYTLPNIVTGEIALRHGIHGETGFFYLPEYDRKQLYRICEDLLSYTSLEIAIVGWIDISDDNKYSIEIIAYKQITVK